MREVQLEESLNVAIHSLGDAFGIHDRPSGDEILRVISSPSFWKSLPKKPQGLLSLKSLPSFIDISDYSQKGFGKRRRRHRHSKKQMSSTPRPSTPDSPTMTSRVLSFLTRIISPILGVETGLSTCSAIMSVINLASWTGFAYLVIHGDVGGTIDEITKFISAPIHYFISQIPEINDELANISLGHSIQFIQEVVAGSKELDFTGIANITMSITSLVKINGALFEDIVLKPVACALSVAIPSCRERCITDTPAYYGGVGTSRKRRRTQRRKQRSTPRSTRKKT